MAMEDMTMEDLIKELKTLKGQVCKEIKKLNMKGDLTPVEIDNATKAVCLVEKIQKIERGEDYNDEGYSESGGHYPWMAYGGDGRYAVEGSYARGRSPMTGRYVSRTGSSYDMEHSGHSIKDRMIDRLETMMDDAKTEYERQYVMEQINRLRSN